ncbi:hypothetical protein [Micromonospora sp. WMMD1082]|uniref:hypothetical protein n=1 Tax=Micromonospora sp. WMMD1082 TaxID=3016104 RepID=UPI0024162A1F|nr:hypothetical protein [Micromonospora sp. WMMD1082]MDG4796194.1 hypothetical protein [Micromonospora sp. WMMD1082]
MTTTDLALIVSDQSALEAASDPGQFVVQACERAKTWLAEALEHGDIEQIVELKSQAEAIRIYAMSKQLGEDARLSATEIVRRAERGIGLAIRKGQAEGRINKKGDQRSDQVRDANLISPKSLVTNGQELHEAYLMTDGVPDEQFEAALTEAKAEGNLSRANVVRKVRDTTAPPTTPAPSEPTPAEKPRKRAGNRKPLPDAFRVAAHDLTKTVDRIERLLDDDRYTRNAEQVSALVRNDLIRASEQLASAINRMTSQEEGSK